MFHALVFNILYYDIIDNLWWFAVPDEIWYDLFHLDYSARGMNYIHQMQ